MSESQGHIIDRVRQVDFCGPSAFLHLESIARGSHEPMPAIDLPLFKGTLCMDSIEILLAVRGGEPPTCSSVGLFASIGVSSGSFVESSYDSSILSSLSSSFNDNLNLEGSRLCLVAEDDDPLRPLIKDLEAGDWARDVEAEFIS